jgi:hypothetical protein
VEVLLEESAGTPFEWINQVLREEEASRRYGHQGRVGMTVSMAILFMI